MALSVSYHGGILPREASGVGVPTLGAQVGACFTVENATIHTVTVAGLYWLQATSACKVRCSAGIANATGGRIWPTDREQIFMLSPGDVIACDTP
jgi:hypothetical protein